MQQNPFIRRLLLAVIAAGATGPLFAHDFWIEPDVFTPAEDEAVYISLRQGVDFKGESVPYIDDWFNDFSMTTSAGRSPVLSIVGNDPAATLVAQPGAQLLGYQSTPVFVQLSAYKFNGYLEEEGIEFIRAERERLGETNKPAPENFIRCAKALIQTGAPGGDIYRTKLGYTLELIPQSDPYKLAAGDELEFEVLYRDEPIEGLQVQALNKASPEQKQKVRTDKNGRATVTIDTPGTWLVKVVQIIPIRGRPQTIPGAPPARWQSYWASFVFALPES